MRPDCESQSPRAYRPSDKHERQYPTELSVCIFTDYMEGRIKFRAEHVQATEQQENCAGGSDCHPCRADVDAGWTCRGNWCVHARDLPVIEEISKLFVSSAASQSSAAGAYSAVP